MKKLSVIIASPLFTISGYGKHSLDIVKSLIKKFDDKWDIKLISNKWGGCTMVEDIEEYLLKKVIIPPITEQPDIWIQISVPNEFQRVGKFNIGITAGIETTACAGPWLEGINRMDRIIVPSNHSKMVFDTTTYDKYDRGGNNLGKLKKSVNIDVIFEGVDTSIFKIVAPGDLDKDIKEALDKEVKTDFNFLTVGQWGTGDIFQERKDISGSIYSFLKAFKDKDKQPGLILKVSGAAFSEVDKERIIRMIDSIKEFKEFENSKLPPIYLFYGMLTDDDMNAIYNHPKVKCMFSLTKGEGYSRTFPEYLVTGKPIITTKFSGHLDYLNDKECVLISGEIKNIHPSVVWKDMLIPESKWLYVDYNSAAVYLKDMFYDYDTYLKKSKKLGERISTELTLDKMADKLEKFFNDFIERNYVNPIEYEDIILPDLEDIKEL